MKTPIFCLFLCLFLTSIYSASYLIDLSGGTGGRSGQSVYTTANATVTSSAVTYSNGNYYYMEYLFNHSTNTATHTSYWLTSSSGNQTLNISLNQTYYMDTIRIYATSYVNNAGSDRKSNYYIQVSTDNVTFTTITPTFVNTNNDLLYSYHDHSILQSVKYVRITLTQEASWGVCLNEIQLYADNAPVPEPHTFWIVLLGITCILNRKFLLFRVRMFSRK